MKRKYFPVVLIIIIFLFCSSIFSEDSIVYDNVIKSMKSEMTRSLQDLKLDKNKAPFYIDYGISYQTIYAYSGTLGSETGEGYGKFGVFNIRVKLGDCIDDEISYIKDIYSMDFKNFEDDYKFLMVRAPIDYTTDMINFQLWRYTDFKYKKAIDIMTKKKETESLDVKEVKKKLPHFTKPEPYKVKEIKEFKQFNFEKFKALVKELSALFNDHEEFYSSSVSYMISETEDFYINSEGSEAYYNNRKITFSCSGSTILKDGNPYSNSAEITFINNEKIDEQKIRKLVLKFIKDFKNYYHEAKDLKSAYVGPAIYKGAEAGYYFKKYFLGLINGNRRAFDKNTLVLFDSLNKKVLPRGTTIIDDPTLTKFKGREIAEFKIDKEGVKPEKVIIVKDGFFKNFLMSKVPIENFPKSNGHCKYIAEESYPGPTNIIVTSNRKKTYQQLLNELKRMCREEGLDNGIIFDKDDAYLYNIKTGSLTRLKNVRLISKSSLPALKKIKMFGNDPDLVSFGTTFGTVISPSILVSEVELKKARKENILRPILPAPK